MTDFLTRNISNMLRDFREREIHFSPTNLHRKLELAGGLQFYFFVFEVRGGG